MSDCIFCKIANGEIPSNIRYEDDNYTVILDNGLAKKGDVLVIHKKHYADLFEISEESLSGAVVVAKKVAAKMKDKLGFDGVNLVQNNGAAAGQSVLHFHLHIIPRYKNDGQNILWKPTSPSAEELASIRDQIVG